MKKIFITAVFILFTLSVNAQDQSGMPRELKCTEEAVNLSFSLGSKLKLGAPRMGPVEILRTEPNYIPGWSFKDRQKAPDPHLQSLIGITSSTNSHGYITNQQNYTSSNSPYRLKIVDRLKNLFPNRPLVGILYLRTFEISQDGKNHL